jgi:hypothetical protein
MFFPLKTKDVHGSVAVEKLASPGKLAFGKDFLAP